jgi:outer membrane protein TolC
MSLKLFFAVVCCSLACRAWTQPVLSSTDSLEVVSLDQFYGEILQHHPIVRQIRLLSETAQQEVRLARGAFDPKVEVKWSAKDFNDKEYYNKSTAYLQLPSWFPVDPKIGVEQNRGAFIDPENAVPLSDNYRQVFTGVSLPLGRGLFTDDRRTALQQAKLFTRLTEAEQTKLINKILLEAAKEYWQWYYAYNNFNFLQRSVGLAEEIYRRVRLDAQLGEASGIDTVQAHITLQQRLVERQEWYLELQNAEIRVSNYLWDREEQPVILTPRAMPVISLDVDDILSIESLQQLASQAREHHPELKKLSIKLQQLDVERKLAREYLKPRMDLSYNFLNQPFRPSGDFQAFSFGSNYKVGVDFSFPLFLRKERAKLGQTQVKIRSTELERSQTEREILNQIQQVYNQLVNTRTLLGYQSEVVKNYERILQAEILNLNNGESDVFKINVQQEKLIVSQSKLLKLKSEYQKLRATLYWAAGVSNLSYAAP